MIDPTMDRCQHRLGRRDGVEIVELELFTPAATFGLHLFVGLWPAAGVACLWAAVVEAGEPVVSLVECEVPLPRPAAGFELRGSGLWSDSICEEPFVHWSYGLEAFALRLDDPTDAVVSQRGERVALGFELEWEADGSPPLGFDTDYHQAGSVQGEVLVASTAYAVVGYGDRSHRVGAAPFAEVARTTLRRPDGTWLVALDDRAPAGSALVGRSLAQLGPANEPTMLAERRLWRGETGTNGWSRRTWPADAVNAG